MELADLDHDERLALVALLELVVAADASVSGGELAEIDTVVAALGADSYRALADEADRRFANEDDLKAFLAGTARQEARELIYGTVLEAAIPDVVDTRESRLLDWLATLWGVTVRVEDPGRP